MCNQQLCNPQYGRSFRRVIHVTVSVFGLCFAGGMFAQQSVHPSH